MNTDRQLTRFRITLAQYEVIDDIIATSEADACLKLDQLTPGASGRIVRLERLPVVKSRLAAGESR